MPTDPWNNMNKQVRIWNSGRFSDLEDIGMPFLNEVHAGLLEEGFGEDLSDLDIPPDLFPPPAREQGPRDDFVVLPLVVGVSVFLGSTVGTWAVEKVCDELYEAKIRPAFENLRHNYVKSGKSQRQNSGTIVQSCVWYDVDQVMVNVVAVAYSEDELEQAESLIPEAHRKALAWLEDKGIQSRVLTYRIRHGQLSRFPRLSDTVPSLYE